MTSEQKAAYVMAQAACVMAIAHGMQAENNLRRMQGRTPTYTLQDFEKLLEQYGVHHNAVLSLFQD